MLGILENTRLYEEKEQLIENLSTTNILIERLMKLDNEYGSYFKKPLNFAWWGHILAFLIFNQVVNSILLNLPIYFLNYLSQFMFPINIVIYIILYTQFNKKAIQKRVSTNKNRINEISDQHQEIITLLNRDSIVPPDYRNAYAVSKFITYLKNGRAENLKEAMNLYEQEIRHDEQVRQIRIMQEIQEATYKKADEAATLGWINLFTRR